MEKSKSLILKAEIIKKNSNFHPKNKHKSGYDLDALCNSYPDIEPFVFLNKYETKTIDFANPKAVKALNFGLLKKYYKIAFWEFPDTNLCPPIPGRVDYIHHISDVLKASNINDNIRVLDIGTGASCIYPILGNAEYNWKFVATDIDEISLKYAQNVINKNDLGDSISLRYQKDRSQIFNGILNENLFIFYRNKNILCCNLKIILELKYQIIIHYI